MSAGESRRVTVYQQTFRRALPARFKEIEVCAGCGAPTADERDCGCPCGTNCRAVRKDGQPLSLEDKRELFPAKYA
jgi:hypothetical protein